MSEPESESIIHQWFRRVWNEGDVNAPEELARPDVISHGLNGDIHGLERWKTEFYLPMRAAFSYNQVEVIEVFTSGDRVFGRMRATFIRAGETTTTRMGGMSLVRVQDGKIAEAWDCWDFLSMLEGLKVMPQRSLEKTIRGTLTPHPAMLEADA